MNSDLRYALRQVAHRPGLSAVIVVMLALGIGATTAMFSLYHQVIVQPLPVPEPERLVNLGAPGPKWGSTTCSNAGSCEYVFSYGMLRDLEQGQTVFTGIGAHRDFGANLAYEGRTLAGSGMLVSGQYFEVLGLRPALGRLIGPHDEPRVDESAVVVLSHAYWQNYFGGRPDILGNVLTVNGQPLEIIGVAPRGFSGTTLGVRPQVFVPLTMRWLMQPTVPRNADNRLAYWVYAFARLRPGVSAEQASAGINNLYGGIINEVEAPLNSFMPENVMEAFRQKQVTVEPGARGQSSVPDDADRPLTLLLGVTALVLLIVCVNIANLLLARGATRAGEMAIRASIGASRRQMVTQMLTEAMVLAGIGLAASIPVAALTLGVIVSILPEQIATTFEIGLSATAVVFAIGVTVLTVLLVGVLPALQATRTDPGMVLKGQSSQSPGGRGMVRFRGTLATVQIAFSMVLLVLAGLFTQSLLNLSRVELGMQVEQLATFSVSPRLNGYSRERTMELYDRIEAELAAQPGVTGVSSSMMPLIANNNWQNSLNVEGFDAVPGTNTNGATNEIGPGFLEVLSIPLLVGREFTDADVAGTPRVAVVNAAFARKFEMGDDVIGKRFGIGGQDSPRDIEIVGLMADAKYSEVKGDIPAQYFLPRKQNDNLGTMNFYVRTVLSPDELLPVIPRVVAGIDPDLPVSGVATMRVRVQDNVFMDRLVGILAAGFAALATTLAAVGLYGVLAYNVTQRTRELGLRLALGAPPARLQAMVMRQVGLMGLIGGVTGLGAALLLGRYAEALLYGLSGYEPTVLAIAGALLGAVVAFAGYVPARRAAGIPPMEALRYE